MARTNGFVVVIYFVQDQCTELDFYSSIPLRQESTVSHAL